MRLTNLGLGVLKQLEEDEREDISALLEEMRAVGEAKLASTPPNTEALSNVQGRLRTHLRNKLLSYLVSDAD